MLSILSVFVVFDQSESIIAVCHHVLVFLQGEKASNLVDVNGHVVQRCRISCDPQAILVVQ